MRVHLPDGMVLQASFQPLEPLQKLKARSMRLCAQLLRANVLSSPVILQSCWCSTCCDVSMGC